MRDLMTVIRRAFGMPHEGHVQLTPEAERRAALDRLTEQQIRLALIDSAIPSRPQQARGPK